MHEKLMAPSAWAEWKPWFLSELSGDAAALLESILLGRNLPAEDPQTEPYTWVLQALPLGREREINLTQLSSAASALLVPWSRREGPDADKLLDRLLNLIAGLANPSALIAALDDVLAKADFRGRIFRGLPLTVTLRYALRWNQMDSAWVESVWKPMILADVPRDRLRVWGDEYDGLDGILAMPLDLANGSEELGWAMVTIAVKNTLLSSDLSNAAVKLWSTFKTSKSSRWSWDREEYPVPKSSSRILTPI